MPTGLKLSHWPALAALLLVSACGAKAQKETPPPEAGYVVMTTQDAPLELELAGRTSAYETSQVRPQVSGVILARRFEEGGVVQKGQTLYEIDPSLYRAAEGQAEANLANAEAASEAAAAKAARYKPLADLEAVSRQDYTDAAAAAKQAAAQVGQAKAALDTARINLRFTSVPAPITGRIGRSLATTGALVTSGQADPLTNIERLDPMFVDIQQSSADLVALRRELSTGGVTASSAAVRLTMEDGSPYPYAGQVQFSEALVDPDTGSVTLRAQFPNPQGLLLPGMFLRAKLSQATVHNAILAPQQGVTRDPRGQATVMIVGPGDKAVARTIVADRTVGDKWLVTQGLAAGDKVIVEGLDRLKAGQVVHPVPAGSPPTSGGKGR
ncbi:MAG: efflux RND transporter periplasmic adaptor subunit [Alphaproteobacteria bacterium]|nr:efflux RND transporter periplasmic adaptor subunit [Alphaproteobacteria bacterium]MBU1513750.1 efflux RND transporter periplasmic adaptor subunit [Alphaproteobacteria bacterium]MBU2094605.1 efflux RND transporter periplasmic adaptor subunit [Alphaproteobacteria bacterium]MBU2150326.1 efflux RND transporter periplasmic adaptor subunit [Alphaproteobacteria bacterium]MBU2309145.1 efflux RND transporter periplasmic adaptor subunit [Alphaproteobacteria bacterium]